MSLLQAGGNLMAESVYVERTADLELLSELMDSHFCYILATRQIGKSSLGNRTCWKLQELGVATAFIDLGTSGNVEEQIWYRELARDIAEQLRITGFSVFWDDNMAQAPIHKLRSFFKNFVLAKIEQNVTIFIDEIEHIRTLRFSTDSFFELIRSLYNERARVPALCRITFCLMGVSLPSELISNSILTPFNVGTNIALKDFDRSEMHHLEPELAGIGCDPGVLLDHIFDWTEGHPYMTLKICEALKRQAEHKDAPPASRIGRIVAEKFLHRGRVEDLNLAWAEKKYMESDIQVRRLYQRLLNGETILAQGQDPVQMTLCLTGLAAERCKSVSRQVYLRVRNGIVRQVFDQKWCQEKESELLIIKPYQEWKDRGMPPDAYLLRNKALEHALEWFHKNPDQKHEHREYLLLSLRIHRQQELLPSLRIMDYQEDRLVIWAKKMIDEESKLLWMLWEATNAAHKEIPPNITGAQKAEVEKELAFLRSRVRALEAQNVLRSFGTNEAALQGEGLDEWQNTRQRIVEEIRGLYTTVSELEEELAQERAKVARLERP